MNKSKAVKVHFQRRCLQRIGCLLEEKEIIKKIQRNELKFVKRQSNRVTVWEYDFMDKKYLIFYDKNRKQVITVYERETENE